MKKNQTISALLIAVGCICWSFVGVTNRFTQWSALSIVGMRCLVTTVVLGVHRRSFRLRNTLWNWVGALGACLTSILFISAMKYTSSANAIVLQYAMTAIVIAVQPILFKTKLRRVDVIAALLVIAGVVLCFCQNMGGGSLLGNVLALGSAVTWAAVFIASGMPDADSRDYTYMGNLIGCVLLVCLFFDPAAKSAGIRGIFIPLLMGVLNAGGYLFFSIGTSRGISPSVSAIVANIEPVLNPTWVFVFFGEFPGWFSLAGAAVVLTTVTVYSVYNNKHASV